MPAPEPPILIRGLAFVISLAVATGILTTAAVLALQTIEVQFLVVRVAAFFI